MNNIRYIALGLAVTAAIGVGSMGVANAATPVSTSSHSSMVGSSGIPRKIFNHDRLSAIAKVLNTSTVSVKTAQRDKTFSQLLTKEGLTKNIFSKKLKTQLTSNLESQGYSQNQVKIALQHRMIVHLRHKDKMARG